MQFAQGLNGNPEQILQNLVQSGRVSQQQLNQAQMMAKEMEGKMGAVKSMLGYK